MIRVFVTIAAVFLSAGSASVQQPTFRAATDAVSVNVSVRVGRVPVAGLTAADFEVRDNGVVQNVQALEVEEVPIDVTLAVDLSGSVVGNVAAFAADVRKFAALLRPIDRIRIVSFAGDVSEDVPMQSPGASARINWNPGGATALNDGLLYALLWPETSDRRHLVIAFTDGIDTFSLVPNASIPEIASRVEVVLHAVLVDPPMGTTPLEQASADALREAVHRTGGETHRLSKALDDFTQIVADFRASYVLHYTPKGVTRSGWHALDVRLTRPGNYTVRSRQGYMGDD